MTDLVRVTDAVGNSDEALATVNPALEIVPTTATVISGDSIGFAATGGVGDYHFIWEESGVDSGGRINLVTGVYTAGATSGVTDTVLVSDEDGNVAYALITVTEQPNSSP